MTVKSNICDSLDFMKLAHSLVYSGYEANRGDDMKTKLTSLFAGLSFTLLSNASYHDQGPYFFDEYEICTGEGNGHTYTIERDRTGISVASNLDSPLNVYLTVRGRGSQIIYVPGAEEGRALLDFNPVSTTDTEDHATVAAIVDLSDKGGIKAVVLHRYNRQTYTDRFFLKIPQYEYNEVTQSVDLVELNCIKTEDSQYAQ